MSQEFQIAHTCPHLTIEESVQLDSDLRTLMTRQPIASSSSVRVIVNNEFYVPSMGLLSPASLYSTLSGPYLISRDCGDDNQFAVVGSTESATLTVPVGQRISTDSLVTQFQRSFTDIVVSNENGHLVFTDLGSVGTESRVRVSGEAATSLGFLQKAARGHAVFPGWSLEEREDVSNKLNRFPRFNQPVKQNAMFKVTYSVPGERCLRCRATFVEHDMMFGPQGEPIIIENESILYQTVMKILLTDKGSNPFFTEYGASIRNKIGSKNVGAAVTLINEDVRAALAKVQEIQNAQRGYQRISAKERLYAVRSVNVLRDANDPTIYRVDVTVSNASGEPVYVPIVFTAPGAVALAGTNGLSLGLEPTGLNARTSALFLR